ncbi:MAG: glycosyltransferase family 4 protein [Saprospiraceae bacterium]|nr:glycosyltransferase family 4 protein [Saprospiraceae bacterium]
MKILLLNTYEHGGAGIACRRLHAALQSIGLQSGTLNSTYFSKWPFYAERLSFLPLERDKSVRFAFSLANFGHDLSRHPLVQEADVLHLHWINQGFLSLKNIEQLGKLGKPIVWTLHDMWAFTGGCHYSQGCDHFLQQCGHCPFLRRPGATDRSNQIWRQKQRLLPSHIQFVTCSEWLAGVARQSGLLHDKPVQAIPNPIDTTVFQPATVADRDAIRHKLGCSPLEKILMFAAMKVSDERKGLTYLQQALLRLKHENPDLPVKILVLGKTDATMATALPYPVIAPGLIQSPEELAILYSAADAFVIPSLEDNLPNTVMESLACGTPVIGFQTGGIPEMVTHRQEGYIVPQKDVNGLAEGIKWILGMGEMEYGKLRRQARTKVEQEYSNILVAKQYLALYERLLQHP